MKAPAATRWTGGEDFAVLCLKDSSELRGKEIARGATDDVSGMFESDALDESVVARDVAARAILHAEDDVRNAIEEARGKFEPRRGGEERAGELRGWDFFRTRHWAANQKN